MESCQLKSSSPSYSWILFHGMPNLLSFPLYQRIKILFVDPPLFLSTSFLQSVVRVSSIWSSRRHTVNLSIGLYLSNVVSRFFVLISNFWLLWKHQVIPVRVYWSSSLELFLRTRVWYLVFHQFQSVITRCIIET